MALLDSNDYSSIRWALSDSFDADTLPDERIERKLILPVAEAWVAEQTVGRTLTPADTEHAKQACVYYAAYLLAPSVQSQLAAAHVIHAGQGAGGVPNWRTIADECLRRATREIEAITSSTMEVPVPESPSLPPTMSVKSSVRW